MCAVKALKRFVGRGNFTADGGHNLVQVLGCLYNWPLDLLLHVLNVLGHGVDRQLYTCQHLVDFRLSGFQLLALRQ